MRQSLPKVAAFTNLDWSRIDVTAIVTNGGIATIDERRHSNCRNWLLRKGYEISTWDSSPGLSIAVPKLGELLCWEQQFGYALGPDSRNLDALRDGFEFEVAECGRVFEILRPDLACREDPRWLCGLLAIAREQSRQQLALGRRFFTLLLVPERSPFIGTVFEESTVPAPFWDPCPDIAEFRQ